VKADGAYPGALDEASAPLDEASEAPDAASAAPDAASAAPDAASAPLDADLVEEVVALRDAEIVLLRPRDSEALIDEDAFAEDEALPYWAELWPSGLALARRLSGRALHGARVVELGCGLGLPSLVAAICGARVLATDWSSAALELLQRNAAANELRLQTLRVDWARPRELLELAPFDLILAADVCYERRNVALLLDLMPKLGPEAWLTDPGRSFTEAFLAGAPRHWRRTTAAQNEIQIHRLRLHGPRPGAAARRPAGGHPAARRPAGASRGSPPSSSPISRVERRSLR
jgi:predicted nicotinamide N-methyase